MGSELSNHNHNHNHKHKQRGIRRLTYSKPYHDWHKLDLRQSRKAFIHKRLLQTCRGRFPDSTIQIQTKYSNTIIRWCAMKCHSVYIEISLVRCVVRKPYSLRDLVLKHQRVHRNLVYSGMPLKNWREESWKKEDSVRSTILGQFIVVQTIYTFKRKTNCQLLNSTHLPSNTRN